MIGAEIETFSRVTFFFCFANYIGFHHNFNPPLLGLLISQGLFSEDGVCYVLTAHLSAFLYICGVVSYGLAYDLCDSTKASWVTRAVLSLWTLFVTYQLFF